jgi:hypothetical protein
VVGKLWKFTSIDRSIAAVIIGSSGSSCSIAAGGAGGELGTSGLPPGTGTHEPPSSSSSSKNRELEEPPPSSRVALLGNFGTHTGTERPTGGSRTLGTSYINAVVLFVFGGAGWLAGFWALEGVKGEAGNNKGTGRGTSHGTRIVFAIAEQLTGANFRNAFIFAATYSLDVAKYSDRSAFHRLGELALRSLGSLVGLWIFICRTENFLLSLSQFRIHTYIIAFILALSRRLYINHLSACQLSH